MHQSMSPNRARTDKHTRQMVRFMHDARWAKMTSRKPEILVYMYDQENLESNVLVNLLICYMKKFAMSV